MSDGKNASLSTSKSVIRLAIVLDAASQPRFFACLYALKPTSATIMLLLTASIHFDASDENSRAVVHSIFAA